MKCPLCKDKELLPARSREDRKEADALKCVYCAAMFQMDETNHLRRLVPAPAMTHTAALAAAGLNPKENREAKPDINPTKQKAAPRDYRPWPVKSKIDDHDKSEIFKRLVMGEKCVSIAAAVGCKPQAVNNYKFTHKAAIAAAQKALKNPGTKVDEKAGSPKKVVHSKAGKLRKQVGEKTDAASYTFQERLAIIAEVRSGGADRLNIVSKKYGLTRGQLRGYLARESYYRQVAVSGEKTVKSARQHRAFVLHQVRNLDKAPVTKIRAILVDYLKLLEEDLIPAQQAVQSVEAEISRVDAAIKEFDTRAADVVKTFKGGLSHE